MSLRCKFKVKAIMNYGNCVMMDMEPVLQNDGTNCEENQMFWEATPSGKFSISVTKPEAMEELLRMKPGEFYYIDITKPRLKMLVEIKLNGKKISVEPVGGWTHFAICQKAGKPENSSVHYCRGDSSLPDNEGLLNPGGILVLTHGMAIDVSYCG